MVARRTPDQITETEMQVEVSAQASPESILGVRDNSNRFIQRHALKDSMQTQSMGRRNYVCLCFCIFIALLAISGPALVAQTGNVVISTNTTYATGTYNLTSLTVENGSTLTVGGGSTLAVSGAVVVTANSNIVLQSSNNTAQVNGAWAGLGVTVSAGSVQVDAGSTINADGQGYTPTAGPGAGPGGSSAGGSYGGAGGGQAASTTYGSATAPTDLGSGGGQYQGSSSPGGGAIRLIVSGVLANNGIISANSPSVCCFVGGSAGGSIYVTAGGLTGSGTFNADGGPNTTSYGSGGGGGRVAVYYNATQSSFTGFTGSTANGGTATPAGNGGVAGAVGTVAFFDTSATNDDVSIYQDYVIPAGSNVQYNSLTVTNGATLTIGGGSTITVAGSVLVTGDSTILLQSANATAQVNGTWQGTGVTMKAGSVQVDSGSSINADGQGYTASAGPGAGPAGSSNGGSYGGLGGAQAASTIYGSATAPLDLGSGGGQYQGTAQPGGGAIRLIVSGTLTDNGVISANALTVCCFVGGSSGGSVYITAGQLAGSGTFNANGGMNTSSYGNGGGGGRVAVYYNATSSSFTGFTGSTANGGTALPTGNGGAAGAVGTVAFFDTSAKSNNVSVYQNYVIPAGSNVPYNSLTVTNGALLTVGGNSTLTVTGGVKVTGNSTVVLQSTNTSAQVNGVWAGVGDTIQAGSLEVDAGSTITADAQGYTASNGPGGGASGTENGGSYGGVGGGQAASTTYGSSLTPVDLGSGGGSYESTGGTGGGAMQLVVSGAFTNNGVVSANGGTYIVCTGSGACSGGFAGGGAGGSIDVSTGSLAGSGTFNADGGPNSTSYGNGGGGGRVIVFYDATQSSFTGFTGSTVNGGAVMTGNGAVPGAVGSLAFFDTSATNDNVAIYQNFTIPAGASPTYNSVNVESGGLLTIAGGNTMTVTNALTVTGTLVAQSLNTTAQVDGAWAGSGVSIKAGSISVGANGSLNADAQGYVGSAGPGGATANTSAGGSYGGLGGVGDGAAPAATYGSEMLPIDLGSGGGSRCCGTTPGSGGGDILLTVSGTLTDDGVISANGADGTGLQVGGGSGGSLSIHTPTLAGSGSIAANGGAGGEAGGGGGRVALYFNSASNFNVAQATATGGSSSNGSPGAVGTVYIPGALVLKATSTTTLSASPMQSNAGQAVTLQAVVTTATGGMTPTGMVNFFDGTTVIGTQMLGASQQVGTATANFQTTALAVGSHSITASYVGDANVLASTSAAQTVTVSLAATTSTLGLSAATITAGQTETLTVAIAGGTGTPSVSGTVNFFDTTANATLGTITVTPTITGGTAVLAVSTLAVGTHVLNARYSGDANYQASTAPNQTLVVAAKTQTITFGALSNQTYGASPLTLTATASSGLALTYTVTGPVTVAGSTLTFTGAGAVTVTASQAGDTTYAAATTVSQSFTVAKAILTATAASVSREFDVENPALTYTTTGFVNGDTASVVGGTATLTTTATTTSPVGTYQITFATETLTAANYTFNYVAGTLTVLGNVTQTITFPAIPNHKAGDAPFALSATASSGLAVTYTVTAGPAMVTGNLVTVTGAGTVTIQASQAGDATYAAATPVSQSFTVSAVPLPTLASITPAGAVAGSAATTITLTGTNFVATDVAEAGATSLATTYVNTTTLMAVIPANLLAAAAALPVSITDSASAAFSGTVNFVVSAAPAVVFTGPATATSGEQPMVTFQLVQPYAVPINCLLTLTFVPSTPAGIVDPTVQFSSGGNTIAFTIPAGSTTTPPVQFQTGTVAGTATVTLTIVTTDGVNVTPPNVAPVVVTLPATVPQISTATVSRTETTSALTVTMAGFSNTREVKTAIFHFTPTPGNRLATTDLTIDVSGIFASWFGSDAATQYGSTFTYTQPFSLNADPSTIQSVTVTLVNSVGTSAEENTQ